MDDQYIISDDEGLQGPTDTLTTEESQATPEATVTVEPYNPDTVNPSLAVQNSSATVNSSPGVGAGTANNAFNSRGSDNTPGPSQSATQSAVNQQYGAQYITPQPNILDRYASYTYQIGWYLLTPDQYNGLTTNLAPAPNTGNWTLLVQDGGAAKTGRNQFFPFDYYLDDLEIETYLMGKGTNMSTNGVEIRFKVTEPNGITLIQNLYNAVKAAYKNVSAPVNPDINSATASTANQTSQNPNYASAQYCLVIEFYGYDSQGNLVAPATGQVTANGVLTNTSAQPIVKKYYPFVIKTLTFRTVANQIEYQIVGSAIPYATGTSQARGTIPFPFALAGQTVSQILQGGATTTINANQTTDGRTSQTAPAQTAPAPATIPQTLPGIVTGQDNPLATSSGMDFTAGNF